MKFKLIIIVALLMGVARMIRNRVAVFPLLEYVSLESAKSFSCSVNLELANETKLLCDRQLVYEHVCRVYGIIEHFDDSVHVSMAIRVQELIGPDAFTANLYCWLS